MDDENQRRIMHFSQIRSSDLTYVGGKGANLGEMTHAGFPVPRGFCLTTFAYDEFMKQEGSKVYDMLENIDTSSVEAVRVVGAKVRSLLHKVPIPDPIIADVKVAWREIGMEHPYAIRSSATAEDLPDASFAGQQDTYLNIIGEESLLDAIRSCWVSLFTDRAILYRNKNNFSHRDVKLSVVVQQMILSEKSGILFTADPITGHRHTLTIDASYGLGEALVSGLVTPDSYHVDKRDSTVVKQTIGEKKIAIFPIIGGGTEQRELDPDMRKGAVLDSKEVLKLTRMAINIENHYNSPQDIEWAIVGEDLYLLQTRPITSLYPIDGLITPNNRFAIYFSSGHQQSMTDAMSPFSQSVLQYFLPVGHESSKFDNTYIKASGGRLFIDITLPLRHRIARKMVLKGLAQMDALAPEAVLQLTKRSEFSKVSSPHIPFRTIRFLGGMMLQVRHAMKKQKLDDFLLRTDDLCDTFIHEVKQDIDKAELGPEKLEAILQSIDKLLPIFLEWIPEAIAGMASARQLEKAAAKWLTSDEVEALTLGIQGNVVNEMNLQIGDLADIARKSDELVEAFENISEDANVWLSKVEEMKGTEEFIAAWNRFMDRYGARGPSEIDIRNPRWIEDPMPLLRVIAEFLSRKKGQHRFHQQEQIKARERAMEKLLQYASTGIFSFFRVKKLKRQYYVMTSTGGMREHHKFLAIRIFAIIKEAFLEIADDMIKKKMLLLQDDIWFLTLKELSTIYTEHKDWIPIIQQRREDYERFCKLSPPVVISSDGEVPIVNYSVEDAPEGAILGFPVSSGVVEGIVHVIHDPQSESLSQGEILVAKFTDPGWTPLFINASALIMEVGGSLTHGAVVAREYGIPAIVGVRDATQVFKTGQRIRINGNRGYIEIVESTE